MDQLVPGASIRSSEAPREPSGLRFTRMLTYFGLILIYFLCKQVKKKLSGLTKEHEDLFNFVEGNKNISTKKEKQKVEHSSHFPALSEGTDKLTC